MTAHIHSRAPFWALLLALGGCALTPPPRMPLDLAPRGEAPPPVPAWWTAAADPLLAKLVAKGLANDPAALDIAARGITPDSEAPLLNTPGLDTATPDSAALNRARAALAIGLAYLDARRAQAQLGLRQGAVAGLRDNAEIAGFRREAGLVSAIDTGLAGVLVGLNDTAILAATAGRDKAVSRLAALTGMDTGPLTARIAAAPALPIYASGTADPMDLALARRADLRVLRAQLGSDLAKHQVTQAELDAALAAPGDEAPSAKPNPATHAVASLRAAQSRARHDIADAADAVTAARARLLSATGASQAAERALGDARLNYRLGKDAIATLYVAEAAALAAREALADAGIAVDTALVRLWASEGRGSAGTGAGTGADMPAPEPSTAVPPPAAETPVSPATPPLVEIPTPALPAKPAAATPSTSAPATSAPVAQAPTPATPTPATPAPTPTASATPSGSQ